MSNPETPCFDCGEPTYDGERYYDGGRGPLCESCYDRVRPADMEER